MATPLNDVKTSDASSSTQIDVKDNAFDKHANELVDAIVSGASTDETDKADESLVSKVNETEEAKKSDEVKETSDDTKKNEETEEKKEETEKPEGDTAEDGEEDKSKTNVDNEKLADGTEADKPVPFTRFKEVNEKAQQYEPLAKQHIANVEFCQKNNISGEQYREAMNTQALLNTNPEAALQKLESLVEQVKISLGKGLPKDLQAEVDEGKLAPNRALELAQSRLKHTSLEEQNRFQQLKAQEIRQQELTSTLGSWAQAQAKLDPDFKPASPKFEAFLDAFSRMNIEGQEAKTTQECVSRAEKALEKVNGLAKSFSPVPKAKKSLTTGSSTQRSSKDSEPKTAEDVMNAVAKKYGIH